MLLEVVADARDVGRDLHLVGEPDAGDLAERRVRLLGRHCPDLEADTALLRGAGRGDLLAVEPIPVLAHGGRLDLLDLGLATVAHELADRRHEDAAPLIDVGAVGRRSPAGGRFASESGSRDLPGVAGGVARQLGPGDAHVDRGPLPRPRTRSVSAARKRCQTLGRASAERPELVPSLGGQPDRSSERLVLHWSPGGPETLPIQALRTSARRCSEQPLLIGRIGRGAQVPGGCTARQVSPEPRHSGSAIGSGVSRRSI